MAHPSKGHCPIKIETVHINQQTLMLYNQWIDYAIVLILIALFPSPLILLIASDVKRIVDLQH